MRTDADDIGSIYFANAVGSGLTKIGFALDVRERIYSLNVGSPVQIKLVGRMPATRASEKALHAVLKPHRVKGEWYSERFAACILDDLGDDVVVFARGDERQPLARFNYPDLHELTEAGREKLG